MAREIGTSLRRRGRRRPRARCHARRSFGAATVDDGCASGYRHILPVLRRHARAIFFVTAIRKRGIRRRRSHERRMTDASCARSWPPRWSHALTHRALSALSDQEVGRARRVEAPAQRRSALGVALRRARKLLRCVRGSLRVGYASVFCSYPGVASGAPSDAAAAPERRRRSRPGGLPARAVSARARSAAAHAGTSRPAEAARRTACVVGGAKCDPARPGGHVDVSAPDVARSSAVRCDRVDAGYWALDRAASRAVKLVFLIDHLGSGGAQRQAVEIARRLHTSGEASVTFLVWRDIDFHGPRLREAGVRVIRIARRGTLDLGFGFRVRRELSMLAPDVLHTFLASGCFWGWMGCRGLPATERPVFIAGERSDPSQRSRIERLVTRLVYPSADHVTAIGSRGCRLQHSLGLDRARALLAERNRPRRMGPPGSRRAAMAARFRFPRGAQKACVRRRIMPPYSTRWSGFRLRCRSFEVVRWR